MLAEHLNTIEALVDSVMTENLGLIGQGKITPTLKEALMVFLPASCSRLLALSISIT